MSEIKLTADSGGGTTSLKAPSSTTSNADVVLKLPVADGSANQVLKTDGSGQLSFGSDISDLVNDTSPQLGGQLQSHGQNINLEDNDKLKLGTNGDTELYHNNTDCKIENHTGDLYITNIGSNSDDIIIQSKDNLSIQVQSNENSIVCYGDGAVELYHDNSKKLETTSSGVKISDSILEIADATCLIDLMETSTTNHRLRNGSGNFLIQRISDDKSTETTQFDIDGGTGAVSLYHEGTKKLSTTANGICFNSDTAAANALDDYEEGTFTPDWNGSNAGTTTYSTNQGSYTKIGNIVHIRIYSGINGTSGSGSWRVTNLPFNSPNGLAYITTGSCMTDGLDFDSNYTWVVPYKNQNSSYLDIYASADNGGWDHISVSDDSSFAIILGITYVAA